jgi:hypothetical protein
LHDGEETGVVARVKCAWFATLDNVHS